MTDTLTFGAEDSGTEKHSVTYAASPGQEVVLSGGREISGWKKGPSEIWTAELPEVKSGRWYFRQLFVNGSVPSGREPLTPTSSRPGGGSAHRMPSMRTPPRRSR